MMLSNFIRADWKNDCSRVVAYRIKSKVTVKTGPVGPQIDLGIDKYLPGGGTQIQFVLPDGEYSNNYLEYISEYAIN